MEQSPDIHPDPALLLDIASGATTEERLDILAAHFVMLSYDVRLVQGSIAANTRMTKETRDGQDAIKSLIDKIDVDMIAELVDAVDSMKGGIRVLGWLERPAKWIASIGAAAAVVYSLWGHK